MSDINGKSARNILKYLITGASVDGPKYDEMYEQKIIAHNLKATKEQIIDDLNGVMSPLQRRMMKELLAHLDEHIRAKFLKCTAAAGFLTDVADVGSRVGTVALLFDKRRIHRTAFDEGSAFRVAEDDLTADTGFTTAEASGTEVVRVVENPSGMSIIHPVEPDLFGDGSGILTKESGDVFKRTFLRQRILDILSTSESKAFLITWNDTGHNDISCFCCLIINRRISYL